MANYKTAFGSYINHGDLQGRPVKIRIDAVATEEVGQGDNKERKLVARFAGTEKGLVLNRTNADAIAAISGSDDTDDWAGVTVVLYPDKTTFGGKTVDCIRVRAAQGAKPTPPPVDDAPFTAEDVPF